MVFLPAEPAVWQTITLHRGAPPKPAPGQACNGCGVCCATEPCPVGMLLSRRRRGPCVALHWSEAEQRYVCGLLGEAALAPTPTPASATPRPRWARALARRLIAAGIGCDANIEVIGPAASVE